MKQFFSPKQVFSTRNLVVMALMIALKMVLSQLSIQITPTFKLFSLAYLPGMVVSMLYGPWAGLAFGFAADIVGYIANPGGAPFFIGYALSEMAANFIYACFLYRQPVRVWKVAAARLLIMLTVTFGLNFIWNSMMYGAVAAKYYTGARIANNLIQLPIHVAIILATVHVVNLAYRHSIGRHPDYQ